MTKKKSMNKTYPVTKCKNERYVVSLLLSENTKPFYLECSKKVCNDYAKQCVCTKKVIQCFIYN